jgi:hypothetical protein
MQQINYPFSFLEAELNSPPGHKTVAQMDPGSHGTSEPGHGPGSGDAIFYNESRNNFKLTVA